MWLQFVVTQYNSLLSSFVPNFKILSQVATEKFLTEKKKLNFLLEGKKNEQIKELISDMWLLFFVAQYNISLSSCVPNLRIISQVVAEIFITEKKLTSKHNYRKGKNYIPPICFLPGIK